MLRRIGYFLMVNVAIMVVLSLFLSVLEMLGFDLSGYDLVGLVSALIFGMGGAFFSLWTAKWMAKRFTKVRLINPAQASAREKWLYDTVEKQAKEAHITMPEVGIFNSDSPNAFATGSSKKNSLVAVSTGLLDTMNKGEIEAILAHEVAHVANGDMVTMALIQGVLNTFVILIARFLGGVIDREIFKNENGYGMGYFIGYMVSAVILTFLASIITMWFSRKREFKADAGAAYLVGKDKMISALERLQTHNSRFQPLPNEVAAFGIVGGRHKLMQILSTHPPLEARIAALKNSG